MYHFLAALGENLPRVEANQATLNGVLNAIYGIVGALAVVFIIVGGIRYSLSAGDSSKIAQAKNTILYAIIGLVIAILAFAITNFIIGGLKVTSFNALRDSVITLLLTLVGLISVISIIYGGFKYVTSNGDASKIQSAKNTILYAVIGIIVAVLAFAIVNFVIANI